MLNLHPDGFTNYISFGLCGDRIDNARLDVVEEGVDRIELFIGHELNINGWKTGSFSV